MTTRTTITSTNGFAGAAKDLVTATRHWQGAFREAALTPVIQTDRSTDPMLTMLGPMADMSRRAHETWLDMWENGSHEMIDRSISMVDEVMSKTRFLVPPPTSK